MIESANNQAPLVNEVRISENRANKATSFVFNTGLFLEQPNYTDKRTTFSISRDRDLIVKVNGSENIALYSNHESI